MAGLGRLVFRLSGTGDMIVKQVIICSRGEFGAEKELGKIEGAGKDLGRLQRDLGWLIGAGWIVERN